MKKKKSKSLFKNKKSFQKFLVILMALVILVQASVVVNNSFLSFFQVDPVFKDPEITAPVTPQKKLSRRKELPISVEGYEEVEIKVSPSIIYLTVGCQQLSMITTEFQSYSIGTGLEKKVDFRPTSHDVFKDMIENFDIEAKMVKIEELEDSTYYAKLFVQQGDKLLGLDSKPSDAIAIAVRFDAPVYVRSNILETAARDTCKE